MDGQGAAAASIYFSCSYSVIGALIHCEPLVLNLLAFLLLNNQRTHMNELI